MNWKTWAPAVAAMMLGGAAAKMARDSMMHGRESAGATAKLARVVSVKQAIDPGQELTPDRLSLSAIGSPTAPANAFTDLNQLTGRVSTIPMVPGQIVLQDFLAPKGAATGLPALVPAGQRAVTIDVTDTSSFAGMLAPGCRVDVVGMITGMDMNKTLIRTIVQNVLVQAVGQRLSVRPHETDDKDHKPAGEVEAYRNVTLICSPKDAVSIQLASLQGRVTLLLRGTGDESDGQASTTVADLRGENNDTDVVIPTVAPVITAPVVTAPTTRPATQPAESLKVVQGEPSRVRWVITYHGGKMHRVRFDDAGATAETAPDDLEAGNAAKPKQETANVREPSDPDNESLGAGK